MNPTDPPMDESPLSDSLESRLTELDASSGQPHAIGGGRGRAHTSPNIPDHELLRVIGRGAYGEVWIARNIMGTPRAVKIVYRDNFDSDRPYEREFSGIQRFEPISRSHESQVDILHVGRNRELGCFYYVMELADDAGARSSGPLEFSGDETPAAAEVSGTRTPPYSDSYQPRTVRSDLKLRGRYSFAEAVEISLSLTTALEHLHKHGLIHRDIKPANVIFVNGRPKLADIGLVTETDATMSFVGTEGYLPPEGPGSVQADLYSLGKTLYEVATGKDRLEFPELPTLTGSPAEEAGLFELNEVLLKACHPDRARRYRTAADMHADLVLLQAGKSVRRSRAVERRLALLTRVSVAGVAITLLLVAGYFYQQLQTQEARRLAQENRELAVKESAQRQRAEGLLNLSQLKEAEHLFENDEAAQAVAYLARMLRQNPSNQIAAARMLSALTHGNFALPVRAFESAEEIGGVEFSPDGARILAWTRASATNHFAWLWDTTTGTRIGNPMRHDKAINGAGFSRDGRWIATIGKDSTARLWTADRAEPVGAPLPHPRPDTWGTNIDPPEVSQFAFSPDGATLATLCSGRLRLWRVPSGELLVPPIDDVGSATAIRFSPDGARVLLVDRWRNLYFFDARTGARLPRLVAEGNFTWGGGEGGIFSPDGSLVAAPSWNNNLMIRESTNGALLQRLPHNGSVRNWNFSHDGLRIAAADDAQQVRIWDVLTGQNLLDPLPHKDIANGAEFDATGERILTEAFVRSRIWDARSGEPLSQWLLNGGYLRSRFSPDGRFVLNLGQDQRHVALWDARPGRSVSAAIWRKAAVTSLKFDRDGKRLLATFGGYLPGGAWGAGVGSAAVLLDPRTGENIIPPMSDAGGVQYAEFSPDGRRLATTASDGRYARVYDARTGAPVSPFLRHPEAVISARFSHDGSNLVTAERGFPYGVRIWDIASGRLLVGPMLHTNGIESAEISPDGNWVLSASGPSTERLWDARTGSLRGVDLAAGPDGGKWVSRARFSPDGKLIAAAYANYKVVLWDTDSARKIREVTQHRDGLSTLTFSADGALLATASFDGTVRVFEVRTGRLVADPIVHGEPVYDADFSRDGRRILVSGQLSARVWDVRSGRPITERLRHEGETGPVAFSPDGSLIATGGFDGALKVWELPPAAVPLPEWVLDLAEAAAGQRFNAANVTEPVAAKEFLDLKERILENPTTNAYAHWARWFVADRLERNTSMSSLVSVSNRIAALTEQDPIEFTRRALQLAPRDPATTARFALQLARRGTNDTKYGASHRIAAFMADQAVELDPASAPGLRAKAEAAQAGGRHAEALTALDRALSLRPADSMPWELRGRWLEKDWRDAEAIFAYSKAIESVEASATEGTGGASFAILRRKLLVKRSDLLLRSGRREEAVADRLRGLQIPARDTRLPANLIDLSAHYYRSLLDDQYLTAANSAHAVENLASLAERTEPLAGVRFDLRGSIRIWTPKFKDEDKAVHIDAPRAPGIPIHQKCRRLHFLHALLWGPSSLPSARFVVHYADGAREEIPIIAGQNVGWWQNQDAARFQKAKLAWSEANARIDIMPEPSGLYLWSWDNPRPEAVITTIDLEPAAVENEKDPPDVGYLLVAITAQTEPTPVITRQAESIVARAGERVQFAVQARSEAPLRYQWLLNGRSIPHASQESYTVQAATPNHAGIYTVEVRDASDDSVLTVSSEPATLAVESESLVYGRLRLETYQNIEDPKLSQITKLSILTNHARFPSQPDSRSWAHQFEAPSNFGDYYGARLSGYLVPPRTGDYRFFICSDDEGALFLSTDHTPENKRQIAHEPFWSRDRLWQGAFARPRRENVSEPIRLEAGKRYYIEALMMEGAGSDNLAVTWQMPGEPEPANLAPSIPGTYLAVPEEWLNPSTNSIVARQ
jgi:WD40 repeat protein/serine/threonine protein kinase/tetratricopeptide (TPR) repeat protein